MTYPQVLLVSTQAPLRRLYHRMVQELDCELHTAASLANALVELSVHTIDAFILVSGLPEFELSAFLDVLKKKGGWKHIPLIVVGYEHARHTFPQETRFASSHEEAVRILTSLLETMEK